MIDPRRCFDILEVGPDADAKDIAQAHRDLCAIWHPDRHGHNKRVQRRAEEKLKQINAAYDVLTARLAAGLPLLPPCPDATQPTAPADRAKATPTPARRWTRRLLWLASAGLGLAAAMEYGQEVRQKIDQATAAYDKTGAEPTTPPEVPPTVVAQPVVAPPAPPPRRFLLIHLTDGTVIQTSACWEEGGMVMYRKARGVIGIEKTKVKKIERP